MRRISFQLSEKIPIYRPTAFEDFGTCVISLMLCVAFLVLVSGCSGSDGRGQLLTDYQDNIRKVHFCYTTFMARHNDVGPESKEELLKYAKNDPTAVYVLKQIGVTPENIEDFFVSPRDGKPFIIRYGIVDTQDGGDHPLVFEAEGLDGKRMVAYRSPKLCSAEQCETLLEE